MPSSSMAPPPPPLPYRRTCLNTNVRFPPSPPYSPETPSCGLRKMSLSKGATFHVPSSPPAEDDPVISIRHLARRSPTCSQVSLLDLISDKKDVAAQSIKEFEQIFSGACGNRLAHRRRGVDQLDRQSRAYNRGSLPSDEGLGSSIGEASDIGSAKGLERALDSVSDSALGTSISSGSILRRKARLELRGAFDDTSGITSEDDSLSVEDLIQGWLARRVLMRSNDVDMPSAGADQRVSGPLQIRQQGTPTPRSTSSVSRLAITHSIAPHLTIPSVHQPSLSNYARKKIAENVLQPILREERFGFFHPLVASLRLRENKVIRCLRDLEQSLIFEPLVSNNLHIFNQSKAHTCLLNLKTLAVPQHLYRTFGEFSIQLVVDTYQHLSEPEQRRAADRPYDNGYFLDLVQQVSRLSAQISSAKQARASREEDTEQEDEMACPPYVSTCPNLHNLVSPQRRDDEVTLEGGLGSTGTIAELVRWKNGKGMSLRTNQPYEALPGVKRQHSDDSLDEDVARSMARRKKNAALKTLEYPCSEKSCGKIFNRKCDVQKHEKTHSRPFKCLEKSCRYHEQGLPTEKELDRHINDKHSLNPRYFHCLYCPFKTKRESNCKQHMEKKHDYQYDRSKGSSKRTPGQTPQQTPQTPAMEYSPPVGATPESIYGGSSISGSLAGTPYEPSLATFARPFVGPPTSYPYEQPLYSPEDDMYTSPTEIYSSGNFGDGSFGHSTPAVNFAHATNLTPATPHLINTPITPGLTSGRFFDQSPYLDNMHMDIYFGEQGTSHHTGLQTPASNILQPHSRNPSISHESPLPQMDTFPVTQHPSYPGMNTDGVMINDGLPARDFPLFSGAATPAQLPTTTDLGPTANFSMFPDMNNYNFNYGDDIASIDDFINVEHMNN